MNTAGLEPHDSSHPFFLQNGESGSHESGQTEDEIDDADTASQPSIDIPLDSPPESPRIASSVSNHFEQSRNLKYTSGSDDPLTSRMHSPWQASIESSTYPRNVATPSPYEGAEVQDYDMISEPIESLQTEQPEYSSLNSRASIAPSFASTLVSEPESITSTTSSSSYAKKIRPESLILDPRVAKLIIGLVVVDFNHIVGPTIEMAYPPSMLEDDELCKILPFLALPDGAHLNQEDYSYFHVVPTVQSVFASQPPPPASPHTIFGISCNRQIATSTLLSKEADVTRSTVQKAIVVLASKPLFGLIRDKLGVVTRAFFNQRDFRDHSILTEFCDGLETSLRAQLTESAVYMGTSLRELVHKFRHRTLMLLKLLMIQKKMMFYGHPVERLCTYQYSLVSLIPGLLLALEDCGAPPLASRAQDLKRATEFKSSDRRSLLKFMGLPLEIFGKDAFFQPYLPLQQMDLMKTDSFLCGSTNSIMTHQRDMTLDLLINVESNTFEFQNPLIERIVSLTPADRKWMDDIVQDVNESWNENDPQRPASMQFKGSDDYLRIKFEDYICSALSCVKYTEFLKKSAKGNVTVSGATGDPYVFQNFGEAWLTAFQKTPAFAIWDQVTDPVIFDIVEPRHPCDIKPSAIADLGLRLTEGIHELKLEKNLGPTRDAISSALSVGSSNFFKAVEGVRSEVSSRLAAPRANSNSSSNPSSPTPTSSVLPGPPSSAPNTSNSTVRGPYDRRGSAQTLALPIQPGGGGLRPLSLGLGLRVASIGTPASPKQGSGSGDSTSTPPTLAETAEAARVTLGKWGAGLSSYLGGRANKPSAAATTNGPPASGSAASLDTSPRPRPRPILPTRLSDSTLPTSTSVLGGHRGAETFTTSPIGSPTFSIRDLDKEREDREKEVALGKA